VAPVIVDPKRIRAFETEKAFEAWLAKHHDNETELWLRIYKKGSGVGTVTRDEAVDVALCWGWIDGLRKSYDALSFIQRFTPRKAKSIWSDINRENVARLIKAKRMTPHGLRHVEAAKADGRWDAAYKGTSTMTFPEDLLRAIQADKKARATYEKLDKQNLYALAFRLGNLRTAAGREKKIASYVEMLRRGESIHPLKTSR
jgi:uncharacterized protein YdeI (YjbR/CyaY-like superfamily)